VSPASPANCHRVFDPKRTVGDAQTGPVGVRGPGKHHKLRDREITSVNDDVVSTL
jgi:hypothetical protein